MKNKKLIRSYKLSKWNIVTLSVYILLSLILWLYCSNNNNNLKEVLFSYTFGTQFFLYCFQYKALRNFNYFLIWLVIGIIHYCIFLNIREYPILAFVNEHASWGLRNTVISLFLFQFLRFLSLKIQNKELVSPARNSRYDLWDDRRVTIVDIASFLFFVIVTILLLVAV